MTFASRSRPSWSSTVIFTILIVLCAIPPRVRGHIQLSNPVPINAPKNPNSTPDTADYDYTSPLSPDGSNFPCKGYHLTTPQPIAEYTAGQSYTASLAGSATHTGGSCQFALSYDKGASFKVIKSMIGGCPVKQDYDFTIPSEAPSGEDVLFAWTWVNREGNREFYMDCAWVTIQGGEGAASLDNYPDLYVANIATANACVTREREDVVFSPEIRGLDVEFADGQSEESEVTAGEECTWSAAKRGDTPVSSARVAPKVADTGEYHDEDSHDHHDEGTAVGAGKPGIFAPGAAKAPPSHNHYPGMDMSNFPTDSNPPVSTAVLGVLAYPSASRRPGPRPIAIGEPHPIALAGYDLYYDHDYNPPIGGVEDTTVTVDVTEACPTEDAVYVTVTASCTSLPDVTVTVIASTITVRPSRTASTSGKKAMTLRRSTIYSVISPTPKPTTPINPQYPNSSWRTSLRPSSPPQPPPSSDSLGYATDPMQYMPCTPGAFLCTSATEFLTCDQWGDGNAHGWKWLYPRPVAAGMMCKPNLVAGRRGDLSVREGS